MEPVRQVCVTFLKHKIELFFLSAAPDYWDSVTPFVRSQASPACPSGQRSINMKTNTDYWWNVADESLAIPLPISWIDPCSHLGLRGVETWNSGLTAENQIRLRYKK